LNAFIRSLQHLSNNVENRRNYVKYLCRIQNWLKGSFLGPKVEKLKSHISKDFHIFTLDSNVFNKLSFFEETLNNKKIEFLTGSHLNYIFSYFSLKSKQEELRGHKVIPVCSFKFDLFLLCEMGDVINVISLYFLKI